jgi:hypothetical protein
MTAAERSTATSRILLLLTLLGVLLACPLPSIYAAGSGEPSAHSLPGTQRIEASDFVAEAGRILSTVDQMGADPSQARALRESIPDAWEVGQAAYPVSMSEFKSLLEAFEKQPKRRTDLLGQLSARGTALQELATALSAEDSSVPPDQAARAKLDEILKRKDFKGVQQPSLLDQWKEKAGRWLQRMLARFFGKIFSSPGAGRVLIWVLIAAIFLVLAVWLGRYLSKSRLQSLDLEAPVPAGKSWRDWARAALAAAKEGRHREALHSAYWAGVYRLEDLGAWRLDRTRTPREYLRLLRAPAPPAGQAASLPAFVVTQAQSAALEKLTRSFELAWYGYQAAGETDFKLAIEQLEVLGCRF